MEAFSSGNNKIDAILFSSQCLSVYVSLNSMYKRSYEVTEKLNVGRQKATNLGNSKI